MRAREQRRGAGCLSFGAGRRTLLQSKDRGQEIGGILLQKQDNAHLEGSKKQGRKAGCRGHQGSGGWGGRIEGVLDPRQPRQGDWAGLLWQRPAVGHGRSCEGSNGWLIRKGRRT